MFNRRKRKTRRPQPQASPATDRNTEFYARQATRTVRRRTFWLMLVLGILAFVVLFFKLYDLQIIQHKQMQTRALDQQTSQTVVSAFRGTIYDRAGNIMAISASAETIILSPLEIDNAVNDKDDPVSWTKDSLAAGLAEILGSDAASIRKRMDNTKSQYEVIKLRAEEETANAVRTYISENKIVGVHLVADAKRYYPYGSLAAHVIGFVGDENTGLYGLEARYEQELEGQSGLVVSAKDNAGNDMMYAYEQYFAAQNGHFVNDNTLTVTMKDGKKVVATKTVPAQNNSTVVLPVKKARLWSPADPFLYDITYEVKDAQGKSLDLVNSYVGMRKIHVNGNKVYLNNEPFYQRLVLDQGFYPDGIWTAPSDEALRHDIELSMQAGFNGARLHQKVFEERFHYWADKMGYITWGEAPSWGMDANNPEVARNFITEWSEEILRDRNHPSIVTWTPMNEEWWPDRVQFPRFVSDVYDITKALDPTRPVCDVSGGVHVKTDIWTTHNYEQDPKKLKDIIYNGKRWFQTPNHGVGFPQRNVGFNRHTETNIYAYPTYTEPNMPYLLDEFGGIKWVKGQDEQTGNDQKSWGYGEPPHSLEEFYTRLEGQIDALMEISENVWGYCYTQLTDVEQEQNGIYFYDRSSKFDMKRIHAIFSKRPANSKY